MALTYAEAAALSERVLLAIIASQSDTDGTPLSGSGADIALETFAGDTAVISSTAVTAAPAIYAADNVAVADALTVVVTANSIRYYADGRTPTASVGFLLASTDSGVRIEGAVNVAKLKMIRATGSDATVDFIPEAEVTA